MRGRRRSGDPDRVLSHLVALVGAAFLVALSPGPGTALVLRQSLRGGRPAALRAVAGMELGVLGWAVAAALGLSVLLLASPLVYQGLRVAGAALLVWLGVRALWSSLRRGPVAEVAAPPAAFRSGLLVNLANPKLGVFAMSFLPQFVPVGAAARPTLLLFALVWVAVDALWYVIVVAALHRVAGWLRRDRVRAVLERVSGGVLIALGVRLALSG